MKATLLTVAAFFLLFLSSCTPPPNPAMVSFTFDDGYPSVYTEAFPVLKSYGFPGTVYMITNHLARPDRMDTVHLLEMQENGWEIGSHTISHRNLATLTDEELYSEIVRSKTILEEAGFTVSSFAPPGGYSDHRADTLIRRYYQSNRGIEEGYNKRPADPYNLLVKATFRWTRPADVSRWLEEASQQQAWLILIFHLIDDSGNTYATTPHDFAQMVRLAQQSNIPVVTISEGLRRFLD